MAISNTVTYTASDGGVTITNEGSFGPPEEIVRSGLRNNLVAASVAQEFRERLASSPRTIDGASAANPVVITSLAHGLANGTKIRITGVVGMVELNGLMFTITDVAANTFELQDPVALGESSSDVDGTGFTAYTSGGSVAVEGISGTATISLP